MSDDRKAPKRKSKKQRDNSSPKCQKNEDGPGEIDLGSTTEYPAQDAKAQSFDTEELGYDNTRSGVVLEEPQEDSFEVEVSMENLIQKKKYAEALHRGRKIRESSRTSFGVVLRSTECYLRMGVTDDMDQIKESVNKMSKLKTGDVLDKLGADYQDMKPRQISKALSTYASAALAHSTEAPRPDDAAFKSSYSIYLFSEAVRKNIKPVGISKDLSQPRSLAEKKFGAWGNSIPILVGMMEIMLEAFRKISGANARSKYKSEAFALNWIATVSLHFNRFTEVIKYCELGLEIMNDDQKCGQCLSELQTYGDLLHNIGIATGVSDVERGKEYLQRSLEIKERTTFKNPHDKQKSINATNSQLARLRLRSQ